MLLHTATAVGASDSTALYKPHNTFQAILTGTGTASVDIECSNVNDPATFVKVATLSLSGNGDKALFPLTAGYAFARDNVTQITNGASLAVHVNGA